MDLANNQVQHANPLQTIGSGKSFIFESPIGTRDFYSHFPVKISGQRYNLLTRGTLVSLPSGNDSYIVHQILVQ